MPKFKTKPQIVEGWFFDREKLADKANVPEWVASRLHIIAGKFCVENGTPEAPYKIEVMDGQWLMKLDNEVFPLSQEALDTGFDPIFDEQAEVKGNA